MIKHKGNLTKAIKQMREDKNNSISHIYENAKNGLGILKDAIFTLKDNYSTIDAKTQASSLFLKDFQPYYDATIVSKIKAEGGAIVAKTHLDELALGGTGTYSAWGLITNPLDSTRVVGGSSSGSVASFSENISVAIGSDTGDSVRLPASYNNCVGFKPSYGAISRYGLYAFASSLDNIGYLAHNVSDIITTSQVLFGKDEKDMTSKDIEKPKHVSIKPKQVAFLNHLDVLSDEVKKHYLDLKNLLEKNGVVVNMITIDEKLLRAIDTTYMIISFSEASSNNANLNGIAFGNRDGGENWEQVMINSRSKGFGPMVQRRFALGAFYLQVENQQEIFVKAQKVRRLITNEFAKIYENNDLLIFPATSIAPKISEGKAKNWYSSYLTHANFSGTPSLVLKWIHENNMPIGLAIDSKIYSDSKMLSHALYLEEFLGGKYE